MSYGNKYSNKPFERASKTSHTNIINDEIVQAFLSKCKIPPYVENIDDKDAEFYMLDELAENPIKNIITVDGGVHKCFCERGVSIINSCFFSIWSVIF